MSDIATDLEQMIQDYVFDGADFPVAPTSIYVALHTGDPGNDGTSNEVATASYSRTSTAPADWERQTGSDPTVVENVSDIECGVAEENWGEISHVSIWSDSTGGNCFYQGALDGSKLIETNDEFVLRTGTATSAIQ